MELTKGLGHWMKPISYKQETWRVCTQESPTVSCLVSACFRFLAIVNNASMHACWVTQSCLTLCDPTDCSPPGSSVLGILQTRILEWVAIPTSRGVFPDPGIKPRSPALQADKKLLILSYKISSDISLQICSWGLWFLKSEKYCPRMIPLLNK